MTNSSITFINKFRFLFFVLMVFVLILTIILKTNSDICIFTILFCWYITVKNWNLNANFSFFAGILLLFCGSVFSIFQNIPAGPSSPAENLSVFAYGYFFFGFIQKILEIKSIGKSEKTLKEFFKEFLNPEIKKSYHEIFYSNFMINLSRFNYLLTKIVKIFFLIIKFNILIVEIIIDWMISEIRMLLKNDNYNNKIDIFLKKIVNNITINSFINFIIYKLVMQSFLLVFILLNLYKQITFYKWFYLDKYLYFFLYRVGFKIIIFWIIILIGSILFYKIRPKILVEYYSYSKEKGNLWKFIKNSFLFFFGIGYLGKTKANYDNNKNLLFILLSLFIILQIDSIIFKRAREKFEFYPYIFGIFTDIASNWGEVFVRGRNFKEMPFIGKVTLNGKEQKILIWDDMEIKIEIDPILSSSGKLEAINDYGFGKNISSNSVDFTYFNSKNTTPQTEKMFWNSLKEKARKSSIENNE